MEDLYFITRCGSLHNLAIFAAVVSFLAYIIINCIAITQEDYSNRDCYSDETKVKLRKFAKGFLITTIVGTVMGLVIPTKNEAYMIYGLGNTIDYIKSNEKAKELPDKAIDALDVWLESVSDK